MDSAHHFLASVASIVLIDLLLAGDNAVVIAMAVRGLPREQRRRGIVFGAGAAVVLRVILTFFVAQLLQEELERVGPPPFDDREQQFAKAMQREVGVPELGLATQIVPYGPGHGGTASSDIGEVSATVPLAELRVAARPLGTAAHHWAQTSCAAHPLGHKGMLVAAKVLAASAVDLMQKPEVIRAAKEEFDRATKGKSYQSPLTADAKPMPF